MGQLTIGLVNGAFYAMLSLGLAVIFGMLNIVNFAHGALYMMGAMFSWMLLKYAGINYWFALILAPVVWPLSAQSLKEQCCAGCTSSITCMACC